MSIVVDWSLTSEIIGSMTSWQHLGGFLRRAIINSSLCRHCNCQLVFVNVMLKDLVGEIAPHLTLSILQQQALSLHGHHRGGSGNMAEKLSAISVIFEKGVRPVIKDGEPNTRAS
jgi:hypothetical protein